MGALGVALNHMGLNLGWVYQFMGNAIGSAVIPLWNMLMWKDANATGAVVAAWGGMVLALATWLIVCQAEFGTINVDNLGTLNPNLAGNIVALASSGIIHAVFSFIWPQNYDFESMKQIEMLEDDKSGLDEVDYTPEFLDAAKAWIQKWGWGFTIIMVIIWPVLSLPAEVFTKDYFAFWVFISIAWSFVATFVIITLPIRESMESISGVFLFLVGKNKTGGKEAETVAAPSAGKDGAEGKEVEALAAPTSGNNGAETTV